MRSLLSQRNGGKQLLREIKDLATRVSSPCAGVIPIMRQASPTPASLLPVHGGDPHAMQFKLEVCLFPVRGGEPHRTVQVMFGIWSAPRSRG